MLVLTLRSRRRTHIIFICKNISAAMANTERRPEQIAARGREEVLNVLQPQPKISGQIPWRQQPQIVQVLNVSVAMQGCPRCGSSPALHWLLKGTRALAAPPRHPFPALPLRLRHLPESRQAWPALHLAPPPVERVATVLPQTRQLSVLKGLTYSMCLFCLCWHVLLCLAKGSFQ